jgi:hypothetical protein
MWVTLDSPLIFRRDLGRHEVREGTLEDSRGRGCQVQQFIIESHWRLWPIIEER